jgi:hypothetical protein
MHRSSVRALLVLPLLAVAVPAAAQERSAPRPTFFLGVALGAHDLPNSFEGCTPQRQAAGEVRAGVALGRLALEGRVTTMATASVVCADPLSHAPPPDGIHATRDYDYDVGDSNETADLRVRYGGVQGFPLTVAAGAGWLEGPDVPYLLASAGVRTGGRVRLGVDVEADWYRVNYRDVSTEWQNGQVVRIVSDERHGTWWNGVGLRLGAELPIR